MDYNIVKTYNEHIRKRVVGGQHDKLHAFELENNWKYLLCVKKKNKKIFVFIILLYVLFIYLYYSRSHKSPVHIII